jgi:hypothetical protein
MYIQAREKDSYANGFEEERRNFQDDIMQIGNFFYYPVALF